MDFLVATSERNEVVFYVITSWLYVCTSLPRPTTERYNSKLNWLLTLHVSAVHYCLNDRRILHSITQLPYYSKFVNPIKEEETITQCDVHPTVLHNGNLFNNKGILSNMLSTQFPSVWLDFLFISKYIIGFSKQYCWNKAMALSKVP